MEKIKKWQYQRAYLRSMKALGLKPIAGWDKLPKQALELESDVSFRNARKWRQRRALKRMNISKAEIKRIVK